MLMSRGFSSNFTFVCARLQMNTLESAQCFQRRARNLREGEIELRYFIAGLLAGVGHGGFRNQRAACGHLAWEP